LGERRVLGVVDEQVAQQQAAALYVAPRLLDQGHQGGVHATTEQGHPARILPRANPCRPFTVFSPLDYEFATRCQRAPARLYAVAAFPDSADILYAGELEIRLGEGLVLATGQALTLSVREFELLAALARRAGAIVTRDELYDAVWGGQLRAGDRSVDVYVSKLRGKLEAAMPDRRFIHTHPGFGYRFQPQPAPGGAAVAHRSRADRDTDVSGLSRNVHIGARDA
jgi:DNA-binding winged helix-turn-helix (wHTH) protein